MARNIGWDFMKQKSSIPRMKKDKLHKLYNACILDNEMGDISILNPNNLPDFDLMTYSFPCTDISVAGKMQGLEKGQTRSGLLWECEKIIEAKKPKYLLMENVKNLVGKKFKGDFDRWCEWLESQGYTNYWQVMNAKDYGVPQNRERVFMVSILGEHDTYEFPQKQELKLRLKDILEDNVDEKYYIDNDASDKLIQTLKEKGFRNDITGIANNPRSREYNDFKEVSPTLCARDYKDPKVVIQQYPCDATTNDPNIIDVANCITARYDSGIQNYKQIGVAICEEKTICEQRTDEGLRFFKDDICGTLRTIDACGDKRILEQYSNKLNMIGMLDIRGNEQIRRVYGDDGLSPTLNTMQGGNRQPKVAVREATKQGYAIAEVGDSINLEQPNSKTRRGRVGKQVAQTLTTSCNQATLEPTYRIRKLTPKECWRLMGVDDDIFDKVCASGISNSQLYKQAGNSIVRKCLDEIFLQLFFKNVK